MSDKRQVLSKFVMTSTDQAVAFRMVREVNEAYVGESAKWGQSQNALALRRTLVELFGSTIPEAGTPDNARLFGILYFFGNASAVRQAVLEKKEKSDKLAEDYKDLA